MDGIDDILAAHAPSPGNSATQAPTAPPPNSIDDILAQHIPKVDPNTGEEIPAAFSGISPATAMNKSPVSAMDRMKLSLGNEAGNISFLKQKFGQVQPIPGPDGKPTKELAVLDKDGAWKRVDPDNGGGADPWKLAKSYASTLGHLAVGSYLPTADETQKTGDSLKESLQATKDFGPAALKSAQSYMKDPSELVKDIAGSAPTALGLGVAGAVDYMSGGSMTPSSAAIAGGTTAFVRTSLGRIVGTYEASPQEQLWDTAFESLLNAGGMKIAIGMKPTARVIASTLSDVAEAFQSAVPTTVKNAADSTASALAAPGKWAFKKAFAGFSVGEDNFDTMVQNTDATKQLMREVDAQVGGNVAAYHDTIKQQQVEKAKSIAQNGRQILSQIYGKMKGSILNNVDENFSANFDDAIQSSYEQAINRGIGKLTITDKTVTPGTRDVFTGLSSPDKVEESARTLLGADAAEYLSKNGLKNAKFSLLSQQEMQNAIKAGSPLGKELGVLATDNEAHGIISQYYNELGDFAGSASRKGQQAAEDLLDFKKIAADKSWSLAHTDKAQAIPGIKALLDDSRLGLDKAIKTGLDKAGVGEQFMNLNNTYSKLNEAFSPLLTANERFAASKNNAVYEGLLNQFLAKPGRNATQKFAVDAAIDAADQNGLSMLSGKLKQAKLDVQIGEAAKAFNPLKPEGIKSGMARAGMAAFAAQQLVHGDPKLAMALGAGAVATSPQFAKLGVALSQTASKGQDLLSKMAPKELATFMGSDKALTMFTNTVTSSPAIRGQVQSQMESMLPQPQQGQGQ